jgi:hypothetical protein
MMNGLGTKCIGGERRGQRRRYWKSADQSGQPMLALLILEGHWMNGNLVGRLKPWLNMPTNGFQRNGEKPMETHIAQGFLRLSLNEQETETVLRTARARQRYLIPQEVSNILKKSISKTLTEAEEQRMETVWLAFCQNADIDQRTGCLDVDVLEKWYGHVMANYHEPLPQASPWDN